MVFSKFAEREARREDAPQREMFYLLGCRGVERGPGLRGIGQKLGQRRLEVQRQPSGEPVEARPDGERALARRPGLGEQVGQLVELAAAAQRDGVGTAGVHQLGRDLVHPDGAAAERIDQLGIDAVARREEAVLVEHLGSVHERGVGVPVDQLEAYERLHERDERRRRTERRLRVHDADLDRAELSLDPPIR